MIAIAVALSGGLGAMSRFVVDGVLARRNRRAYPVGTLVVNVLGSFLLGLLIAHFGGRADSVEMRALLGTGFLGGFTTFSAASVEVVFLVAARRRLAGVALGLGMLVASLAAAWLGFALWSR